MFMRIFDRSARFIALLLFLYPLVLQAARGFLAPADQTIPQPVQALSGSVYRLVVFGNKIERTVSPQEVADYRQSLNTQSLSPTLLALKQWEIDTYFTGNGGDVREMIIVTAFLVNDQRTIATCRMALDELVEYPKAFSYAQTYAAAKNALFPVPFDIALLDTNGKLLFSSRKTTDTRFETGMIERASFNGHVTALAGLGPAFQIPDYQVLNLMTNYLELELTQTLLGNPLSFAETLPDQGSRVFTLSYPFQTTGRSAGNSDGQSLYASVGARVDPPTEYQAMLSGLFGSPADSNYLSTQFFHDADFSIGSSGGPVLDGAGNVLAIINTSWAHDPLSQYSHAGGYGPCAPFIAQMVQSARDNPTAEGIHFQR